VLEGTRHDSTLDATRASGWYYSMDQACYVRQLQKHTLQRSRALRVKGYVHASYDGPLVMDYNCLNSWDTNHVLRQG